jgi:hypothetical protein
MANIFWIPNSPIKSWTVQTCGPVLERGMPMELVQIPSFNGVGRQCASNGRFSIFLPSLRDVQKRHPSSIGKKKGVNNPTNKEMDISQKFVGNFIIEGVTRDKSSNILGGCTVDLFSTIDDIKRGFAVSDNNGYFKITLGNDSYHAYYMVAYLAGSPDVSGITINTINTVQQ